MFQVTFLSLFRKRLSLLVQTLKSFLESLYLKTEPLFCLNEASVWDK